MEAFLSAFGIVIASEFFDKTQLLAMSLTGKYKKRHIMFGLSIAFILLNIIAVTLGSFIGNIKGLNTTIKLISGISFLIFALFTLKEDSDEGEEDSNFKFKIKNPVIGIAITFFLAEFGDKSQLAAVSLSMKYPLDPIFIFLGAVLGLIIVNVIGVYMGSIIMKRVSPHFVKWISFCVFLTFGILTIKNPIDILINNSVLTIVICLIVILASIILGYKIERNNKARNT